MNCTPHIRNQITITDNRDKKYLEGYSTLELASKYSKNKNNYLIFEKLLLEELPLETYEINKLLMKTIIYEESTGSIDAIKLLIRCGADVNSHDHNWRTPLYNASLYPISNIETVKFLIESGANISGDTFIHFVEASSKRDDLEIIKLLIRKGCEINYKDKCGETPLMCCFYFSHNTFLRFDLIKILLDNKADIY